MTNKFDDGTMTDLLGRPVVSYSQLNDSSWITVHPNGEGTKGVPVRISENGTIEAGMGGKHNGKKLSELGKKNNSPKLDDKQRNDIAKNESLYQKYGEKGQGSRAVFKEQARSGKFDHLYNEHLEITAKQKSDWEASQAEKQAIKKEKQTAKNEAWKEKHLPKLEAFNAAKKQREQAEQSSRVESAKTYQEALKNKKDWQYLEVPYSLKEHAKSAGAIYDPDRKKWAYPKSGEIPSSLKQYHIPSKTFEYPMNHGTAGKRPTGKISPDDPSVHGYELLGWEGESWSSFLSTPTGRDFAKKRGW